MVLRCRKQIIRGTYLAFSTILIFAFMLSACAPSPAATPTSLPTATIPANPPLPPSLAEASPLSGSLIGPQESIVLYFDQAMDRQSVENALRIQPEISGTLTWEDDATLKFTPDAALPAGEDLQIDLGATAKSANGLTLQEPLQIAYQVSPFLDVTQVLPTPDANEVTTSSVISVAFNQPVVALGAEAESTPPAFTISPAVSGRGEWLNTSTYVFYPEPDLSGGTDYTIALNDNLTGVNGSVLDDTNELAWHFSTTYPSVIESTALKVFSYEDQVGIRLRLDSGIQVRFNQSMDTASCEQAFSLKTEDGTLVPGQFTWSENNTVFTYQPANLLARDTLYLMNVDRSAKSRGGAEMAETYSTSYRTVGHFSFVGRADSAGNPLQLYNGMGWLSFQFSAPIQVQNLEQWVEITPAVEDLEIRSYSDGGTFNVSGYLQPSTAYSITFSSEMKDIWGESLGAPVIYNFQTMPANPGLTIPAVRWSGEVASFLPEDSALLAYVTNLNTLNILRDSIPEDEYIGILEGAYDLSSYQPTDAAVSWQEQLEAPADQTTAVNIAIRQSSAPFSTGLYFFSFSSPQVQLGYDGPFNFLAVVSQVQMTMKYSQDEAVVWLVDSRSNTVIPDREVTLYDADGNVAGSAVTDDQGIARIPIPEGNPDEIGYGYDNYYAQTGQPGDDLFGIVSSSWGDGLSGWNFGLPILYYHNNHESYIYTDRPLYQAGQTVYFRAVLRDEDNARYSLPDITKINVNIYGPVDSLGNNDILQTQSLSISPYGTINGEFTLSEDASPGQYEIYLGDEYAADYWSNCYFDVAVYRKPEFEVNIAFDQENYAVGDDIKATVDAQYYMGSPVAGQTVSWSLTAHPSYFSMPDGYQTGSYSPSWYYVDWYYGGEESYTQLLEGEGQTDADGNLEISIPYSEIQNLLPSYDLQNLVLEATIVDESGAPVSGTATARLHAGKYHIGVRSEAWSVEAGNEIGYSILTVDADQNPSGGHALTGLLEKVTWVVTGFDDGTGATLYGQQREAVSSVSMETDEQGRARITFVPPDPGTYLVTVEGDNALTEVMLWVGGAGTRVWPELPNAHIVLTADAESYVPGDTAQILIPNPLAGAALALVTVERDRVMRTQVVQIEGASETLSLPLSDEDAPNVFVSVLLLGENESGMQDYRIGYVGLSVKPVQEVLQVQLIGDPQEAEPGETATFTLVVKDSEGNPVEGEFSLAVVDKALLALTDPNSEPIDEAYYGYHSLSVFTGLSLTTYAGRYSNQYDATTGGGGRGGGGSGSMAAQLREQFEDTAFWSGTVVTGADGTAEVEIALPDNLTTWVAEVRGITKDSRVGSATTEIVTTKDLLVRPVTPQFLVMGDHMQMAAVVHNRTDRPLTVRVSINATGFTLDNPDQTEQNVQIDAGSSARVNWFGTVQDVESVSLTFSAEAGGLTDQTRPYYGDLPVLRYESPQSSGTAGVLRQAGEQLELVNLPRSFTPTGGELQVELSPSLASSILDDLDALKAAPFEATEPIVSRLLSNLAAYDAVTNLGLNKPALENNLEISIKADLYKLMGLQNYDGGWGWATDQEKDPYLSAYALLALTEANEFGFLPDRLPYAIDTAVTYLATVPMEASDEMSDWELNQMAFQMYILARLKATGMNLDSLYDLRDRLAPWGQAFLALTIDLKKPGDPRLTTLVSDLESTASASSTGISWPESDVPWSFYGTTNYSTAVVLYAIAQLDPASVQLPNAVRYLAATRRSSGLWDSTHESAWVVMALVETLRGTGETQADFSYGASFNTLSILEGQALGPDRLNPVSATVALDRMYTNQSNSLSVEHGEGEGNLYYRTFLRVFRPVEQVESTSRGITVSRNYTLAGLDCAEVECSAVSSVSMTENSTGVVAHVTLVVPEDMSYVVVEDYIPAGTEILNTRFNTSQQGETAGVQQVDASNPFSRGWGWWLFGSAQIYTDHIRWVAHDLPAGTYELTYQLIPLQPGQYRVLPAHAYQNYFPDVQGTGAGAIFTVEP